MAVSPSSPELTEDEEKRPLAALRAKGWMVAVHNDYRLNGLFQTFWLLTHPNGTYLKGEGGWDEDVLRSLLKEAKSRERQN